MAHGDTRGGGPGHPRKVPGHQMSMGMSIHSGFNPAVLEHYLQGLKYPTNRDGIIRHAKESEAPDAVIEILEKMPDVVYTNPNDLSKVWGELE